VDWEKAAYNKFQVLPRNARFVEEWSVENLALLDVAQGIREAVERILEVKYRHLVKTILKDNNGIVSDLNRDLLNESRERVGIAQQELMQLKKRS
jgi:hypothetical protein